MTTVFIVASDVGAAQNAISQLRNRQPPLPEGTLIVPVFADADMRGRTVRAGDVIVVTGDWSSVADGKIQRLVGQFNVAASVSVAASGNMDAPYLKYKAGEAPIIVTPTDTGRTMDAMTAVVNRPSEVIMTLDGQVIQLRDAEITYQDADNRVTIDAASAYGGSKGVWLPDAGVLGDLRTQHVRDLDTIQEISERVTELREWLSGVQPIEDDEIPGLYRCGCCHRGLAAHADGCPVASPD